MARFGLNAYAGLALLYLFVPIIWIVVFSFNQPNGNYNVEWQEFTLDNWRDPFGDESLTATPSSRASRSPPSRP